MPCAAASSGAWSVSRYTIALAPSGGSGASQPCSAANTRSVTLETVLVGPSSTGYVGAAAGGTGGTSLPCVVQYATGNNIGNLVVVPVGPNNTVRLRLSAGTGKLYADLVGYHART